MPSFPKTPTEIATLVHESVHAIEYIFESLGEKTNGEVFAHSIAAIVRTVLKSGKI
jgi:hypothetical protein